VSPVSPAPAFVAGRYLLRERIGAGVAGEVWRAEDPRIGRRVALKFLRIPEGLTPGQRAEWEQRFLLEARAAGRLSHPGIVSVYDVGTASDGRPFIVMELVEGRSLEAMRQSETRPTLAALVTWIEQLAEALDAAHGSGVIHRDVKPANILVGADGRARIADFGIARVAESELTRDGTFVGSPAFAAPEQLCGAKVDGRADQFALAAVFYLLATGRRPFEGDDIGATIYAVCHLDPEPPGLSPAIDAVILRALSKAPDARYRTTLQLGQALAAAASPDAPPAPLDRAEARAGSIGSAAAVGMLRGARATARVTQEAAAATSAWIKRTWPQLGRVESKRWWQLGAVAALVLTVLLTARAVRENRDERRESVFDRFRAAVTSKQSRVIVFMESVPANAVLEVREGEHVLLHEPAASGLVFHLSPGDHDLSVTLTGDGLDLTRSVDVDVDPRAPYALRLGVATWPWKRISADWDRLSD